MIRFVRVVGTASSILMCLAAASSVANAATTEVREPPCGVTYAEPDGGYIVSVCTKGKRTTERVVEFPQPDGSKVLVPDFTTQDSPDEPGVRMALSRSMRPALRLPRAYEQR